MYLNSSRDSSCSSDLQIDLSPPTFGNCGRVMAGSTKKSSGFVFGAPGNSGKKPDLSSRLGGGYNNVGKSIYELQDEQLQLPQPLKPGTVPTSQQLFPATDPFLKSKLTFVNFSADTGKLTTASEPMDELEKKREALRLEYERNTQQITLKIKERERAQEEERRRQQQILEKQARVKELEERRLAEKKKQLGTRTGLEAYSTLGPGGGKLEIGGASKDDIISDLEGKNHLLEKRVLVLEKELVEAKVQMLEMKNSWMQKQQEFFVYVSKHQNCSNSGSPVIEKIEKRQVKQRIGVKGRIGSRALDDGDEVLMIPDMGDRKLARKQRFGSVEPDAVFVDETALQRKKPKHVFETGGATDDGGSGDSSWVESMLSPDLILTQFGEKGPVKAKPFGDK
jgi:hypothetical protein